MILVLQVNLEKQIISFKNIFHSQTGRYKPKKNVDHNLNYYYYYKRLAMQGRERGNSPYQSEDPSPTLTTHSRKEEKGKIVEDRKMRDQLGQQKGIGPAIETRQSHTIEYRVNQIVPERY